MSEVQQEIICQIQMPDLIYTVRFESIWVLTLSTILPVIDTYIRHTIDTINKESKSDAKHKKKYHQSLCGSIKPSSKEGHKKVKSKLIKSTNLKEIFLPNI